MAPPGARDVAENEGNPSGLFNLTGILPLVIMVETQKFTLQAVSRLGGLI